LFSRHPHFLAIITSSEGVDWVYSPSGEASRFGHEWTDVCFVGVPQGLLGHHDIVFFLVGDQGI
jgi:hypothetical protein